MTGHIELGSALANSRPSEVSLEMEITRADGTIEHRSVTTTFDADGKPIATTETFGPKED